MLEVSTSAGGLVIDVMTVEGKAALTSSISSARSQVSSYEIQPPFVNLALIAACSGLTWDSVCVAVFGTVNPPTASIHIHECLIMLENYLRSMFIARAPFADRWWVDDVKEKDIRGASEHGQRNLAEYASQIIDGRMGNAVAEGSWGNSFISNAGKSQNERVAERTDIPSHYKMINCKQVLFPKVVVQASKVQVLTPSFVGVGM